MKAKCKAIYLCERCWSKFSVDVEAIDTGKGQKEVFVLQTIFHDCPFGGQGRAVFMHLTDAEGGR